MIRDDLESRIKDGMTLVLDRYAYSGVAYTSAKGLPLEWCKAPDSGLPKPDLTIFLDVPIEGSASRGGFGGEKYEKVDFQIVVRKCFDQLKDDTWIFVDGTKSIEEVTLKIQNAIESRISFLLEDLKPLSHLDW